MRTHEIENWVHDIIERVLKKEPVEDTRVELKADWPKSEKGARRIAGHANAAHGEPILWIIGVDEKAGTVPGASQSDFASWWAQTSTHFNELGPTPRELNIPTTGTTVVAILFETDRAPFVVKNPAGGPIGREVPWREGTSLKSATRANLLRLLSPLQRVPVLEILGAQLCMNAPSRSSDSEQIAISLKAGVFLTQPQDQEIVIPQHRVETTILWPDYSTDAVTRNVSFDLSKHSIGPIFTDSGGVQARGSGAFVMRFDYVLKNVPDPGCFRNEDATFQSSLRAAHMDWPMTIETALTRDRESDIPTIWSYGDISLHFLTFR